MKKVLVVDDSQTMRTMVELTLKEEGFDVILAEDGQKALEEIQGDSLDLVITDINMPNVNGIELITKLRAIESFKYTPILVLTTEAGDEMKQKGKAAGATGWIVKPFDPEMLLNAVNKVVG